MPAPVPSATLVASRLRLERGPKVLLADVSCTIGPGIRLGVVGANGVGKSTLLEALAGAMAPAAGRVDRLPPSASVGLLAQEAERRPGETGRAFLERRTGAARAEAELLDASTALASGTPESMERYSAALEAWTGLGVDSLEARTRALLGELGLPEAVLALPTAALSGGQAARLGLAAILLGRFDILLLDEPTNNLDFDGIGRLEAFLRSREGATVVVSHDRAFLEVTVNAVLDLDAEKGAARAFQGGWAAYLEERDTARRHAEEAYAGYAERRSLLLQRARREREWATSAVRREKAKPKDGDKLQRDFRVNRTERLAQRARRTERAIERLEAVEKPWEGWELRFGIEQAERSGAVVARLEGAVLERDGFLLGPVDLEIGWADRVLLTGPNGSGKTTLLGALLGRLPLSAGSRYLGPSVVVGELGQERDAFGEADLLRGFSRLTGLEGAEARTLLAKFGLGAGQVTRPAPSLSPGERTRAELAAFQARGVNLLVLDEPTNHLDLPAIEQLEEALASYAGTLLLVTHDRRLLEAVEADRVVEVAALSQRA